MNNKLTPRPMRNLCPLLWAAALLLALLMPVAAHAEADADDAYSRWRPVHSNGVGYTVRVGFVLGGTSPIPIPATIREVQGFSPWGCTMLGFEAYRDFNRHWGVQTGVRLRLDGMNTKAKVKNYHTSIVQDRDQLTGYFTGVDETDEHMFSIVVPFLASYRVCPRWVLHAGPYIQWALYRTFRGKVYDGYLREGDPTGQKVVFTRDNPATYNFKHDMRRMFWGGEVGADWQATSRMQAFANLNFGFNDIFHDGFNTIEFSMYPIYLTLGFAYNL